MKRRPPGAHCPDTPLPYTTVFRSAENPHRRGMLFAGTGHAFFYSRDDGKTWTQFKGGLPAAPVNWIEVPKNAPEVAVATYGRGLWIMRNVWKLEQRSEEHTSELQSLMRNSYAVFGLKKKKTH